MLDADLPSDLDLSQFQVQSKTEIVHILQAIMQKNELVTAYINQGEAFILTSILMIDKVRDEVILDYGSNEALNLKLLGSSKTRFVTHQDKVIVEFCADRVLKTKLTERDAFCIKLPDRLLKLQRREYYRLITPVINPLRCVIPVTDKSRIEVTVVDLSVGGVGIMGLPLDASAAVGRAFQGCRIMLPEIGAVTVSIEIRSFQDFTLRSGAKSRRYGCQFVDAPESMQVLLQRYINKQERDRRSRLAEP